MKHDTDKLKQLLPLDKLIHLLGHAPIAQRSACCPFHEDKKRSFSMYRSNGGGLRWKCFAGCGEGDEIDFVQVFFNLPDVKAAIETYAGLAGNSPVPNAVQMFSGRATPAKVVKEPKPIVPAKLEPLTPAAAAKIAKWRGLKPAFVQEMSDKGILGLYQNKPAFKAEGGVQYRVPGDGWRYSVGAKATVLVFVLPIGDPEQPQKDFFVVESNWDALALRESGKSAVVCTRGAANARLAIDYINGLSCGESMSVVCIPHNDKPGEDWVNDLRDGLNVGNPLLQRHAFKVKRVPKPYKDFAELWKAKKEA